MSARFRAAGHVMAVNAAGRSREARGHSGPFFNHTNRSWRETMRILPGHISHPSQKDGGTPWPGPRCANCGKPIGGDGSMAFDCKDNGQTCMTMDRIPPRLVEAFAERRIWSNAIEAKRTPFEAARWLTDPLARRIERVREGRGLEVLEEQYAEFPALARLEDATERNVQALRLAG